MKILKAIIVMICICALVGLRSYLTMGSFIPGLLITGVVMLTWTLIAPELMIDYFSRFPLINKKP